VRHGARAGLVLLVALLTSAVAHAHDFWIDPSSYRPAAGTTVDIVLRLGHGPDARTVARDDTEIERFVLASGDRVVPVAGRPGADPAGRVAAPADGCWWVAYVGGRAFSALEPARFENYLRKKGLEHVIADRQIRGEGERYGSEVYTRYAKALMRVSDCETGKDGRPQLARPVGLMLEIVPEVDPAVLHPGDRLPLRILFRDQPAVGVLVEAVPDGDRTRAIRERTDAEGRARIDLQHGGRWLLSAVHMERGAGPERADWESWWASLSFELHGARWHVLRFDRHRVLPGVPVPIGPFAPSAGR